MNSTNTPISKKKKKNNKDNKKINKKSKIINNKKKIKNNKKKIKNRKKKKNNYKEYLTTDEKFWKSLTIEKIDEDSKNNDEDVKKLLTSHYKLLVKTITKWRYTKDEEADDLKMHNDILFDKIIERKKEILQKRHEDTKEKTNIKNNLIIQTKKKIYKKKLLKEIKEKDNFLKIEDYGTILHKAIKFGSNINVIKHIYNKSNKAVELKNQNGNTPLHIAADLNKIDIVLFLISEAPKAAGITNKMGKLPLNIAEEKKHKQIIQILKKDNLTEKQKKIVENENENEKDIENIITVLKTHKKDLKKLFENLHKENKDNDYKDLYTFKNGIITLQLEKGQLEKGNKQQLQNLMDLLEKKINKDEEEKATKVSKKEIRRLEKKYGKDTDEFKKELEKLKKMKKILYNKERNNKKKSQHKTNHAVTALKRYIKNSKKIKKSSYPGKPPPIERPATLTENDLLNIKKREKAEELLTMIGGIYGYESAEYKEVLSFVLTPTSDKKTKLNSLLFKISEIKPDGSQKRRRAEKLLKKYDDFLKTLQDPDEYNIIIEEMSKKASMKLLGKTKIQIEPEIITPSTGFLKKFWSFLDSSFKNTSSKDNTIMHILPILTNLSELTGVTIIKLMEFFTKYGIDKLKNFNLRRFKTMKRYRFDFEDYSTNRFNPYFNRFNPYFNRFKSTLKNNNSKHTYKTEAMKILKKLYDDGYGEAIKKMRNKTNGGYDTRKKRKKRKKRKREKKRRKKRFTFRKKN